MKLLFARETLDVAFWRVWQTHWADQRMTRSGFVNRRQDKSHIHSQGR